MIEIEVPKDIRRYEAKLVGAFTARQVGCLVAAAVICVPVFFLLKDILPRDAITLIIMILAIPFVLVGWVKPYGMTFELFARTAFISNVLSPKQRKYVTMNVYEYEDPEFGPEKVAKRRKLLTKKEMRKEMNTKINTKYKYYV